MALSRILDRGRERAWFYRAVEAVDSRGNRVLRPERVSSEKGHRVTVTEDRQSKAELAGQVDFRVLRMHLRENVMTSSWDAVWFRGRWWEPANPEWDSVGVQNAGHQELLLHESNQVSIPGLEPPENG